MKKQLLLAILTILLSSCNNKFTLSLTIESINNYHTSITIDQNKNYHIEQQNIYLDKHAGKENITTYNGQLTNQEYKKLKKLLHKSHLHKMKNSYGFDKNNTDTNPLDNILYQLTYTHKNKTKQITIQPHPNHTYPTPFTQLIKFLTNYISYQQAENPKTP